MTYVNPPWRIGLDPQDGTATYDSSPYEVHGSMYTDAYGSSLPNSRQADYELAEQSSSHYYVDPMQLNGTIAAHEAIAHFHVDTDGSVHQLVQDIETGFGNDDRLMEQALDKEEEVARKDMLLRQQRRIDDELARLEAYGEDVYEDDTVIMFRFRFDSGNTGTVYTYVALKIRGLWYLSGQSGAKLIWDDLIDFWSKGTVIEMWLAASWEPVI